VDVNETTTPKSSSNSTTAQPSTLQTTATPGKSGKLRYVLVRGHILVKPRNGTAKASSSCGGGGKVLVTITKGKKVVGRKLVSVTSSCAFKVPVALASGTTGKLKVEVRFLGNRALKATKRTTSLQVNG
jgi:hypothetical protein